MDGLRVFPNQTEPKIAKFEGTVFEKYVSRFDIPVYNIKTNQILTGDADFIGSLAPIKIRFLLKNLLQITSLAVLGNDVTVVSCPV